VTHVNHSPVANNGTSSVVLGQTVQMRLTGFDNDVGDTISRGRLLGNPSNGKVFTTEGSEITSFPFNVRLSVLFLRMI
jgi:hypothetical protein